MVFGLVVNSDYMIYRFAFLHPAGRVCSQLFRYLQYDYDISSILFFLFQQDEDRYPGVRQLLARAIINRGLQCGKLAITKDRRGMRFLFPPGMVNRILDTNW